MPHAVGDIILVTWRQLCLSQRFINTQHYRVVSSSSSNSDTADSVSFADHLAGLDGVAELIGVWKAELSEDWKLDDVRVKKISPSLSAYAQSEIDDIGLVANPCNTPNVAAVVTKRGTGGTRRSIGSLHFGGFTSDRFLQGNVTASVIAWWENLEPLWSANQTVASTGIIYQPVIYNPGESVNWQSIFEWTLQGEARVMRRRTLSVGE